MTAVLFGDIEDALIDWMNSNLTPGAFTVVPKPTKESLPFYVVQRLGGPSSSVVTEDATVTIESWGKSDKSAHDNSQLARQAIHNLPNQIINGLVFYRVQEFSGPARLPATTTSGNQSVGSYPRFVFTVSITVRGFTSA